MIQIRRSYFSLIYAAILLFLLGSIIVILPYDAVYFVSFFCMFGVMISMLRRFVHWKYIIVKDDQVTVHADYKTERFPKKTITKLFFQTDPFESSYFQLKSGKKIRFNSFGVPRSELKKLRGAVTSEARL